MLRNEDIGNALRHLRGDRSQTDLAKQAGVNRQAWNAYESGRRLPAPDTWPRIMAALGVAEPELDRAIIAAWVDRLGERERATAPGWRLLQQAHTARAELDHLISLLGGDV